MLQMSQIEKPRCSATIDQMRLRWAMNLPVDFQNVSSSRFHSEIQLGLRSLITVFLSGGARPREPKATNAAPALESVSPRAAALPVQCARRRTAPAAATASLSLYKLRANRQHGNKVPANQSDKSSNRIPAARSGGQICPPESSVQKL